MFTISAFADEIGPNPKEQIRVLKLCRVRHIEFRSIYKTNVLALSEAQLAEFQTLLQGEGFALSAIGSPIGKYPIDAPFEPHLEKFKKAIELAHRFGTPNIRIFSYYPPADKPFDGNWAPYRDEILKRMAVKVELAAKEKVVLFHENEHKIFGDEASRVVDLIKSVNSPHLRAAYDAANYVFCGYDPLTSWHATKDYTAHIHIKDWTTGEEHGRIAGTGEGKIPESIADCVKRGYKGFATMEPHLRGGGPTGGVTGPDLFPLATKAFQDIVDAAGGQWN